MLRAAFLGALIVVSFFSFASADFYYSLGQQQEYEKDVNSVTVVIPAGKGTRNIYAPCVNPEPILLIGTNAGEYTLKDDWVPALDSATRVDSAVALLNHNSYQYDVVVANHVLKAEDSVKIYITSEFCVKFSDDATQFDIDTMLANHNVEIVTDLDSALSALAMEHGHQMFPEDFDTKEYILRVTPEAAWAKGSTIKTANALYESDLIEFSVPNFVNNYKPDIIPDEQPPLGGMRDDPAVNDSLYPDQWNLHGQYGIQFPECLELTQFDTNTIRVTVLGSAFPHILDNPDINLARITTYDASLQGFEIPDLNITPNDNPLKRDTINSWLRGLHAVGAIAAQTDNWVGIAGIASNTKVLCVKVCGQDGIPTDAFVARGCDMGSILGAFGENHVTLWTFSLELETDHVEAALKRAYKYHVVSVAGAWKDDKTGSLKYPATSENTITVAGYDKFGFVDNRWNAQGCDFLAPGKDIYTIDPPGNLGLSPEFDGCWRDSSFYCGYFGPGAAAAHVAGIVCRIFQQAPEASGLWFYQQGPYGHPQDFVYQVLQATASPVGKSGDWGHGRVNLYGAIEIIARGDADNSGEIDIDDIIYLINRIFQGGPPPVPSNFMTGDANCDMSADIEDVVYLIGFLFQNGPNPHGSCFY